MGSIVIFASVLYSGEGGGASPPILLPVWVVPKPCPAIYKKILTKMRIPGKMCFFNKLSRIWSGRFFFVVTFNSVGKMSWRSLWRICIDQNIDSGPLTTVRGERSGGERPRGSRILRHSLCQSESFQRKVRFLLLFDRSFASESFPNREFRITRIF